MIEILAAIGGVLAIFSMAVAVVGFVEVIQQRRKRKRAANAAALRQLPDYPRAEITGLASGGYKVQVVLNKSGAMRGEWYEAVTFKGAERNAKLQLARERRELELATQKPVIVR